MIVSLTLLSLSLAQPEPPRCRARAADRTAGQPDRAAPRRLGELPPAATVLTVYRRVDGCIRPVMLRSRRTR